jgi:imidazolonepropionase-like amidohydrolase
MKNILKTLLFSLVLLVSQNVSAQYDILIKNVTVISMRQNDVLKNKDVGIANGKITFIGNAANDAKAKQIIDGTAKFLMPGLYDMHVHWADGDSERYFKLQTLAGITSVRIMKSEVATIAFRNKNSQNFSVPQLHIGFPIYSSDSMSLAEMKVKVKIIKKEGYDFIKTFGIHDEPLFDELVKNAKRNKLMVCGHFLGNINTEKLILSGYHSIEHVGFEQIKSPTHLDSLLNLAAKKDLYICPTLDWVQMVYHSVPQEKLSERSGYAIGKKLYDVQWDTTYTSLTAQLGEKNGKLYADYMSKDLAKKITVLEKIKAKNINVIAGSDAEEPYQTPGFSLIEELKLIQKAGFSNYDLLKTCTINAATFFHEEKKLGTVEQGKQANLIVLSKNPLEDVKNLEFVEHVIKGSESRSAEELLKEIK